jgi:TDG/mug DNA glycosylase family protein
LKIVYTQKETIYSFAPIFDNNSKILILGTMPSPASLRAGMYYSHPQNSFWKIIGCLLKENVGSEIQQKVQFLLSHCIALWDTLKSCEREGALDSNIKDFQPSGIYDLIIKCKNIKAVYLNGGAAYKYYKKFHADKIDLPYFLLPSTSPANQSLSFNEKLEKWSVICRYL